MRQAHQKGYIFGYDNDLLLSRNQQKHGRRLRYESKLSENSISEIGLDTMRVENADISSAFVVYPEKELRRQKFATKFILNDGRGRHDEK